jgi:homoserine dehydrogenase
MTSLRVGIAGIGTVGGGLFKLLQQQAKTIEARCGVPIAVTAISARNRTQQRDFDVGNLVWHDNATLLARDENVDVVCELIGGSDGISLELCLAALEAGKHVVTANKALMAIHGSTLAQKAENNNVELRYEAAVAGGIPIIKAIREGLSGNTISGIFGILNGTCNYILTEMHSAAAAGQHQNFQDVLKTAQELGYAEADPSTDIDGIDAAHKLALLSSLAFGTVVDFNSISVEGIRYVSSVDIEYAVELGYVIKLLAVARKISTGVEQRVQPSMVSVKTPIAHVNGVSNAVVVQSDFCGETIYQGPGAGEGATASAVASDIVDIARGHRIPTFAVPAKNLEPIETNSALATSAAYYIRLMVLDKPGVIADVAARLRDHNVSMESMLQRSRSPGDTVPVVITTHETDGINFRKAMTQIETLSSVVETPRIIHIESL